MPLTEEQTMTVISDIAVVKTQNEEIIRRLNQQNGRVDRLEAMQWKIALVIAGSLGGIELLAKFVL